MADRLTDGSIPVGKPDRKAPVGVFELECPDCHALETLTIAGSKRRAKTFPVQCDPCRDRDDDLPEVVGW
ncbi:MAG: hypothetical protein ABI592_06880 [Acidobacteriota bacterium]